MCGNTFCRDIFKSKTNLKEADEDQSSLLVKFMDFKKKQNLEIQRKNKQKKIFLVTHLPFLKIPKEFLMLWEQNISNKNWSTGFSDKVSDHSNLKILNPKQMLQSLPIAFAQVKKGNTYKNLLNEIRQIICFCVEQKKSLKNYITI